MPSVDRKLNSVNAAGFRRSSAMSERMLKRAAGEYVEPATVKVDPSDAAESSVVRSITNTSPRVVTSTNVGDTDNTVTIENKNIPFEVAYPHDTKLMAIGLNAMSVDISDDSVSILMRDTVQIKLPKLVPLHLTVNGQPYNVCWAGGSHNFGKFKHISFVIVE